MDLFFDAQATVFFWTLLEAGRQALIVGALVIGSLAVGMLMALSLIFKAHIALSIYDPEGSAHNTKWQESPGTVSRGDEI